MEQNELLEPFARMLEAVATPALVRKVEEGEGADVMWNAVVESGFLDALVAEDAGGFGLSLADVGPLFQALGRFAVPLPVGETMIARALLAAGGAALPEGAIALSTGVADGEAIVPLASVCRHVLADRGDRLELIAIAAGAATDTGVRGDLSARVSLAGPAIATLSRPEGGLRAVAAVLRSALISGAAERLLEMTTDFANERVQFGKPIGRQQALQQNLAVMAEDVIATRISSQLACAAGLGSKVATAATAKAIASAAAARIANTAHAVHGAIGISEEYDLQLLTRRLHEWRLSDGSEGYWTGILGAARLADGPALTVDWVREHVFA